MGCRCDKEARQEFGVCEVCRLVYGDISPKSVRWCWYCKAWICERHWGDYPVRAKAAMLRARERYVRP